MSIYGKPMYYRRDGSPIWYGNTEADLHQATFEWGRLMEGERRIGDTTLPNGIRVSTVWLGLDHRFGFDDGPPLIFESMAFAAEESVHKAGEDSLFTKDFVYHEELDCERYATEAEAAAGHKAMCEKWASHGIEAS